MLMQWLSLTYIERAVLIALYQSHYTGLYTYTVAMNTGNLLGITLDEEIIQDVMVNRLIPLGLTKLPYNDNPPVKYAFYMLTNEGYNLTHKMIVYHNVLENFSI